MLHLLPDLLRTMWALVLRECPGRTLLSRASSARAAVADHLWLVAAVLLRPILGGPGPFERRCFSRALRLDPPSHRVEVRELATATVNGGKDVLRATLWLPSGVKGPLPTVIIRNPYGSPYRTDWGQVLLAERGYAVLLQDTRGRFGSDGDFVPVEHEREDGLATVRWAREQPWCSGRVGVFGVSYLGLTAWAAVGACGEGELQAAVPVATTARVRSVLVQPGGAFSLELVVLWVTLVFQLLLLRRPDEMLRAAREMWSSSWWSRAKYISPLSSLDRLLLGRDWDFFQQASYRHFRDTS